MDRKKFLHRSLLGFAAAAMAPIALRGEGTSQVQPESDAQIGFNHLPNNEEKTMKTVLHRAETRGRANHGWLDSHHTFSFANYHNPERMNFGVLRVLNDDIVKPSMGFGTHPHNNMEIISIPLQGSLKHKDSMGNTHVIRKNDVQIMSAGSGITHSEYNESGADDVNFLQIWVFPKQANISPRYGQVAYPPQDRLNKWQEVVSPNKDGQTWINQDAWFSMATLEAGKELSYQRHLPGNGLYIFVLEGGLVVEGQELNRRDGFGIWETEEISLSANQNAEVLLMEVPMSLN